MSPTVNYPATFCIFPHHVIMWYWSLRWLHVHVVLQLVIRTYLRPLLGREIDFIFLYFSEFQWILFSKLNCILKRQIPWFTVTGGRLQDSYVSRSHHKNKNPFVVSFFTCHQVVKSVNYTCMIRLLDHVKLRSLPTLSWQPI